MLVLMLMLMRMPVGMGIGMLMTVRVLLTLHACEISKTSKRKMGQLVDIWATRDSIPCNKQRTHTFGHTMTSLLVVKSPIEIQMCKNF